MDIFMDFFWAFLIGGLWCVIGQLLIDLTKLTPARILVSFVVLGVILGGTNLYDSVVETAGAGATVPLVGFGYMLAKGVRTAVERDGLLGVLTGGLTSAAGGLTAVMVFALMVSLMFKRGDKMN